MPIQILHDSYIRARESRGLRFNPLRVRVSRGLYEMLREAWDRDFRGMEINHARRTMTFRGVLIEIGSDDNRPVVEEWVYQEAGQWANEAQVLRFPNVVDLFERLEPEPEVSDVDFS
jgi:hypothetical protein